MTAPGRTAGVPVVRIITRLNIGGPSIQAATLTHRLEWHGFRTHLIHGRLGEAEGDMSDLLPSAAEASYLPWLQRAVAPADDARALRQIYQVLCTVRPAIVHTHMAKAGALGRTATALYNRTVGRRMPARVVHTYHGHVLEGYFGGAKTAAFIAAERLLARATDRIVAISPKVRDELLHEFRIGRAAQYRVVPLGFDLDTFARVDDMTRLQARQSLGLSTTAAVVTTVGRLTAIKQHTLLLEAAALVKRDCHELILLIAGDGELRGALERQAAAAGLTDHVRFLGWRRDLVTIYAASDVFALTSINEGTPVALIEAMASAVPGVSTAVGGVRDVIGDDQMGVLVPPANAPELAAAIVALLGDPERRRAMGTRARSHVLSRYTLDRLVTDIASLYADMLGQ